MRKIKFVENNIYHIYNRGVEKRKVFLDDNDRWRFLQALFIFNDTKTSGKLLWELERLQKGINFKVIKNYFAKNNIIRDSLVRIIADCLMPNHFHLLIEEIKKGGISKFMHKLGTGYTMYFNKKHNRVGPLFQGAFKAALVDKEDYLKYLLVYINVINPGQLVDSNLKEDGIKNKRKIIDFASQYFWSTNKEYLQTRESIIIDKGLLGSIFSSGQEYRDYTDNVLSGKVKFENIDDFFLE